MDVRTVRRKRLEQLLELAQAYQGCSRKELARLLGRDRTKLVPVSGVPKLDMVIDLCRVLDWPVGDVAGFLWPGSAQGRQSPDLSEPEADTIPEQDDFETRQLQSRDAQRRGEYSLAVSLAQKAAAVAETSEQRAKACSREAVAWDGLGHYAVALETEQRGLQESSISPELRRILESNLANAYYTLWSLTEARSLSRDLIDWYAEDPPATYRDRCTQAFSYYVRGNTLRRLIASDSELARRHAERAFSDLEISQDLYRSLAKDFDESFAGIANTCRGAIIETEVTLGRDAKSALDELAGGLDNVIDPRECPAGDWLESYGWWCIFGCNIALRDVSDERDLQHHMAIFTNKADEIADRMNSWSLRERVFTMQYASHQRFVDWTGRTVALTLDNDDLRALVGTMGRFPAFRETGWRLLQTARVVRKG